MARQAQPLGDGSIVAAGGWCAPTEVVWDFTSPTAGHVTHVGVWSASNPPLDFDDDFLEDDDDFLIPATEFPMTVSLHLDHIDPEVFDILAGNDWDPSE